MAPTDDPAVGVVPSTNEVFFKSSGSIAITVVAPLTGTYEVALVGRPGSYEFGDGGGLCTQAHNIASAGSTNSFRLCTSDQLGPSCKIFSMPNEVVLTFSLEAGVNTLWFASREFCSLASQLSITSLV